MSLPFLTAHWRNLIFLNYEVSPDLLAPFTPSGTSLDSWNGNVLASIVAFHFTKTKLFGVVPALPRPNFEEINLRFYVTRNLAGETRRGVVFIKEVVPSQVIATTARVIYQEPYEVRPMWRADENFSPTIGGSLSYGMRVGSDDVSVSATTTGIARPLKPNSVEEFILEHYWGYTKRRNGTTSEYRVRHAPWLYWSLSSASLQGPIASLYPDAFKGIFEHPPHSAFVAQGSPVSVFAYRRFR
jgi:uncharacterized protein